MKQQFVRYLVVGVGNTLLSFIAYRLLLAIDTPYAVAALLAFAVGALNGYIFNRRPRHHARPGALRRPTGLRSGHDEPAGGGARQMAERPPRHRLPGGGAAGDGDAVHRQSPLDVPRTLTGVQ